MTTSKCIFYAFLVQLLFISYTFPIKEIISTTPLFYIDNSFHWYYLKLINNLSQQGSLTGYDPYFAAGTIGGISSDVSGHAGQLLSLAFKGILTEIQAWKACVFLIAILGPIMPSIALRVLDFRSDQIIVGTILSIILWWTSWFHWFHVAGMISYVFSAFLSILIIALFIRYSQFTNKYKFIWMSVLVGLLIFLHPLAIILITIFLCCFYLFNYHTIKIKQVFFVVCIISSGILINLWWLIPFFSISSGASSLNIISYQSEVNPVNIGLELIGIWQDHTYGSKVYPLLFLLSGIAIFRNEARIRQVYIWPFMLAWIILELYAWTAGTVFLLARLTQPNRFAPAGYLLLIIPAAQALKPLDWQIKNLLNPKRVLLNCSLLFAALLMTINGRELLRETSYGEHGHYALPPPNIRGIDSYTDFVLKTLAKNTDKSARILFETSLGRIHDQGHLAGYYAYISNREFIGGPYPYTHFSGFWDGFVFGSPINDIPTARFLDYLKLYNIGWIIAHTDVSKDYLRKFPNIIQGPSFKELQFYTVDAKHSYFINGSGTVENRGHNLLQLERLSNDTIILKYHYYTGLKTNTATNIEPIYLLNDPIPFIKINNPPKQLTINFQP